MSDVLTYQGYSARVEFDAEDRIFFGRLAGIQDGIGFHADTVDSLEEAFHDAVNDYIETCARLGKLPDRSYSGNVMLCIDPSLHACIAVAAQVAGKSLNQFGEEALRRVVG